MRHLTSFSILFIFLMSSCETIKNKYFTDNPSYYKIYKHKTHSKNKTYVTLLFYDTSRKPLIDLPTLINENGKEVHLEKGKNKHSFNYFGETARIRYSLESFGMLPLTTKYLNLKKRDSIVLKIYLHEDNKAIN